MLTRDTLTRQAFDAIVEHILDRQLKPGDVLPSTSELTEQFGISRPLVREALSALQACGFVEIRSGRIPVVGKLDGRLIEMFMARAARMQDRPMSALMEVRIPLEIQAAKLAAERSSDEEIRRIGDTNARMASALGDSKLYPELDTEFHSDIALASANHILNWMVVSVRAELMTVMVAVREYREANGLVGQEQEQHDSILETIRDHDPEAAGSAMKTHLHSSLVLVREVEDLARPRDVIVPPRLGSLEGLHEAG